LFYFGPHDYRTQLPYHQLIILLDPSTAQLYYSVSTTFHTVAGVDDFSSVFLISFVNILTL
jgi:hypothetical protein